MKSVKLFSLFVATAFSFATVKAQTADEVITKHIEAIGGLENWKKVTSLVQTGTMAVQGMNIDVVNTIVHNKGSRQDINIMGMNNYVIITPTAGWSYMPVQQKTEVEPMTEEQVKQGQDALDIQGSLVDYKAKGHAVELLGKEDVDGTECFKLKVTKKDGGVETNFIDPKTYYIVKSTQVKKADGQETEVSYSFSNFTKLPEGIVVPMGMTIPLGPGFNADFTIAKVEVNKAIDESIFKPAK
jgi:hypothetical protein